MSASVSSAPTARARRRRCVAASGSSTPTAARSRWSGCLCRRPRARRASGSASFRRSTTSIPISRSPRTCEIYGRYFGIDARDAARADSEAPRVRRPRDQGQQRHPHALGWNEAAAHPRSRARQRSRAPDPRRADDRSRPAGAPSDLGRSAAAIDAGQDDPAHDALHGRGRAARDAARRDRPRHDDRVRHAARADRDARGARGHRGLRRRREGVGRTCTAARSRRASSSRRRDGVLSTRPIRSRCSTALADAPGVRYLHRPANLEDLFIKLTGRELRD